MDRAAPREILLHTGLAKTGTTSIQQFCVENADELSRRGIYYPKTGRHGPGHQVLGIAAIPENQVRQDVEGPTPIGFDQLLQQTLTEFKHARLQSDLDRILLSSERFGSLSADALTQLGKHFGRIVTKPILYLRRQDLLAESLMAQAMRVRIQRPENKPIVPRKPNHQFFQFHMLIRRWGDVFGHENVIVRKFEKRPDGKDIVHDFLEAIDASDIPRSDNGYHLNSKLSRDALEYLYFYTDLVYGSREYNAVQKKLVSYSKDNPTPDQYKNFFAPAIRLELLEKHEAENNRVAREYFGADVLFRDPYPSADETWEAYPGLADRTRKDIVEFIAAA
jgi:hypothetical protein